MHLNIAIPINLFLKLTPSLFRASSTSIKNGYNTELDKIDKFVDGAAVKKVGDKTF